MAFKYETEKVKGLGNFTRFICPDCGREGLPQFDQESAKENARLVHRYGSCPDDAAFVARRDKYGSPVPGR
jgi:predicted RNA-binding Zn-ribbon protein involved in translation (DUF1610 family)